MHTLLPTFVTFFFECALCKTKRKKKANYSRKTKPNKSFAAQREPLQEFLTKLQTHIPFKGAKVTYARLKQRDKEIKIKIKIKISKQHASQVSHFHIVTYINRLKIQ